MNRIIKNVVLLFVMCVLPACMFTKKKTIIRRIHTREMQTGKASTCCTHTPITVWIHGTRLLPSNFLQNYFFSKPGLHHYQETASQYYIHRIAQTLIDADPYLFCKKHMYLFGWNGKLSHEERIAAARELYRELKKLRQQYYNQYGHEPKIHLFAHSHGGNIALLLDHVKDANDCAFEIEKLVLLATPVQTLTMNAICSKHFKKVYALYSPIDTIQVLDPQGLYLESAKSLFSERCFACQKNLEQVAIKYNDRWLRHIEFIQMKFLKLLPRVISEIDNWHPLSCTDCNWHSIEKRLYLYTNR